MSVFLSPVGGAGAQFFDNSGNVLTGGKLYTYAAGTTTPQATYTSSAGSTFHANPIVLDAAGRVPSGGEIWLADSQIYKFVLKDSNDVLLATWDQLTGVNSNFVNYTAETELQTATSGQTVFTLTTMSYQPATGSLTVYVDGVNQYEGESYFETDSTTVTFVSGLHVGAEVKFTTAVQTTGNAVDASVVTYDPPFTGSVTTNVEAKLAQTVSVKDFGAVGDGVTDDTAAIQAAIDSQLQGGEVFFPPGTYRVNGTVTFVSSGANPQNLNLRGSGAYSVISFYGGGKFEFDKTDQDQSYIRDLTFVSDGNAATSVEVTVAFCLISGCQFKNFENALVLGRYYIGVVDCFFEDNVVGISNKDAINYGFNANYIQGCLFSRNTKAIYLYNNDTSTGYSSFYLTENSITNCTFELNTDSIVLYNACGVLVNSCWFEAGVSPAQNITADHYSLGLKVINCWGQYTSAWMVKVNDYSTAYIYNGRQRQFTASNNSTLYFMDVDYSQSDYVVTKDATSSVLNYNARVNGNKTPIKAVRAGSDLLPSIQNHSASAAPDTDYPATMNIRWFYDGIPTGFIAGASKSGTVGSYTPMDTGNTLGALMFAGAGATKLLIPAQVSAAAQETYTDATAATSIQFWTTPTGSVNPIRRLEIQPAGHLYPYADNSYTLGGASNKWSVVYAATGTINTSDANEKQDIENLDAAEKRVATAIKGLIKKFRFKDAVQSKGDEARIHIGVIAQEVMDAFQAEGLDANRYGLFCFDEWEDRFDENGNKIVEAGNRYGVRYEELLAFIIGAL